MMNFEEHEKFHPQYSELHAELLARPFPVVAGQVVVSHRAIFFTAEEAISHRMALTGLSAHPDVLAIHEDYGCQILLLSAAELRIERHAEFTTFTVFAPQSGGPFEASAMDAIPQGLLDAIPGRILAAVEIASMLVASADAGTAKTMERVLDYFGQERVVGGWVVERVASVWSHFHLDENGATRFLVQIHRLTSGRYGRLLQRLVEIETYRMAAMLSLPLARELLPQIAALEKTHVHLVEQIGSMKMGDESSLLADLTQLTLAAELLRARCGSRFSLTTAYARIVFARVRELREEQVPSYQTFGEFFDRRLVEAWSSCERAEASLNALSARLLATTHLLRTSVEVNRQKDEKVEALASIELFPMAPLPVVLPVPVVKSAWPSQRAVMAVVILTYCILQVLRVVLDGVVALGLSFSVPLMLTVLLPFLVWGIWRVVLGQKGGRSTGEGA